MTNRIPITAEIVKLAQLRCRATGSDVRQEIARQVAMEAIMSLDPELDFLIDEDQAFSRDDRLVAALDVNDIVINGVRLDVRVVGDDERVNMPRHLVLTSYMQAGTLAVTFFPDRTAAIIGDVPNADWELQDKHASAREERLIFRASSRNFDLAQALHKLLQESNGGKRFAKNSVSSTDLAQFCAHRQEMILAKQREVVDAVLNHEETWAELDGGLSKAFVKRTLTHASLWNHKVERMADALQPKFRRLNKEDLKASIARTGEKFGGQPESSRFRKEMLLALTREELARTLSGDAFAKASRMVEQVFSGRRVGELIKESVKSKTAIDLAVTIKRGRKKISNFIDASADELSMAMRQLALQPVYATHSQTDEEGIDSVNEVLKYLDACELAESIKDLDLVS